MSKKIDKIISILFVLIMVVLIVSTCNNILDMKAELNSLRKENTELIEEIDSLKRHIIEIETPEEEIVVDDDMIKYEEDIHSESDIMTNREIDKEVFAEVLADIAPNLIGIEDALYENYEEHGIDPTFQLAVFCLESGYGTSSLSKNKNNICGHNAYPTETLSSYENATTFNTKSECVIRFGENIDNMYISQGLITVSDISRKYCPPNHKHWSESVSSIMRKINDKYQVLS